MSFPSVTPMDAASTVAAQASSSAAASLSAISSTTVAAATSVAASALGNPQGERKTKDGQEEKQKSAEYDAVRGEQEVEQARWAREREVEQARQAREREALQTALSATSVAAGALGGQQREHKASDIEREWEQVLRSKPENRQKELKNFYDRYGSVVVVEYKEEETSAEQPKSKILKRVTGFPTADLFRSLRAHSAKFQGRPSLFGAHPLGLFSVNKGNALFQPALRVQNCMGALVRGVQPIDYKPAVNWTIKCSGVTAKDTGRSRLHVEMTATSQSRLPCDLLLVTDGKDQISQLAASLFDQLTPQDRVACISMAKPISCILPFTQVRDENTKKILHHVLNHFDGEFFWEPVVLENICRGIVAAFEELEKVDRGAHRSRIVHLWVGQDRLPSTEPISALDCSRSSVPPVIHCYSGDFRAYERTAISRRQFTTFLQLGCCPLMMGDSRERTVKLESLSRLSHPHVTHIPTNTITIFGEKMRVLDVSCVGKNLLTSTDEGSKGFSVFNAGMGRLCRDSLPVTCDLDFEGTPLSIDVLMPGEKASFKWEPQIQATLTPSPLKICLEGLERILYQTEKAYGNNELRALEALMKEIPARHLVLLNGVVEIQHYIEGYHEAIRGISVTDPNCKEKMKALLTNLRIAIGDVISRLQDYDWDQLPAYIRIHGLFAEALERHEILWKGTPKTLEERLKQGPLVSPQLQSGLDSIGLRGTLQTLIISYVGDVHTRYAAIEGVRHGLLCAGIVERTREAYGKDKIVRIERDRKTREEIVVEKDVDLVHHKFQSMKFSPYSMRLTPEQLNDQTKWHEHVLEFEREFRTEYDPDILPFNPNQYE